MRADGVVGASDAAQAVRRGEQRRDALGVRDRARLDGQSSEGVDADWALVTTPRAGEIRQRW